MPQLNKQINYASLINKTILYKMGATILLQASMTGKITSLRCLMSKHHKTASTIPLGKTMKTKVSKEDSSHPKKWATLITVAKIQKPPPLITEYLKMCKIKKITRKLCL
jgi:hypothetical protein